MSVARFLTDFNFNVFSIHAKNFHNLRFGVASLLVRDFFRKTKRSMTNTIRKKQQSPKWIVWTRIRIDTNLERRNRLDLNYLFMVGGNVHVSDFIVN